MIELRTSPDVDPLSLLSSNGEWIDALLALFWAVDAHYKDRALLPPDIEQAYEQAEKARQRL